MNKWISVTKKLPAPQEEVLVWVDGHRGPAWRNNHALVAYIDQKGNWWEERHPTDEPLVGVILWQKIGIPSWNLVCKCYGQEKKDEN